MAIDIPPWLNDVLNAYGIPWPDIDEDAFHALPQPLRNFGQDLHAVGDAIDSALRQLEAGNSSHTLRSVTTYFEAIRRDFLSPIAQICDDLAGTPCSAAYESIRDVKEAILVLLTAEIANDLLDVAGDALSFGTDTAAAAAEAYAVREAVAQSLKYAEGEVVSVIVNTTNQCLDDFVNSLINPFIAVVSSRIQGSVDSYAPHMLLQQGLAIEERASSADAAIADRLHLSPDAFDQCVTAIFESSSHLKSAAAKLDGAIEELFSHPAPNPQSHTLSSEMRTLVKGVVHTVEKDLVAGVEQLIDHIIDHFVDLLQDFKRAVDQLDQEARAIAAGEHLHLGPEVVVLSAAGVGAAAAADVLRTSGLVNGEEAESVQVETVVAVEDAESLAVSARSAAFRTEAAIATDAVDELRFRTPEPTRAFASAASGGDGPTSLQARKDVDTPHASAAGADPGPTGSLDARRKDQEVRQIHDASPAPSPAGGSDLHVKHPEGQRPTAAVAGNSSHSVNEVGAAGSGGKPDSDASPVAPTEDEVE
jgi:hypothetical protein